MTEQNQGSQNRRHLPRGPADEFAFRRFGGPTTRHSGTVLVGTTPTRVLANNPNRVAYQLVNNAGTELTINFDEEFSTGTGPILGANGGALARTIEDDGNATGDPVFAIASSANQPIWYEEIVVLRNPSSER